MVNYAHLLPQINYPSWGQDGVRMVCSHMEAVGVC